MYKAEFDALLRNDPKEKNFILFGESTFFIDRYAALLADVEDANLLTQYFDEYDFTQAKQHLAQASLFGGTNVLLIKNDKKIPKLELQTLFELADKGTNRFIFAYYGSDHKTYNNAFKSFNVISVRFFHPKHNESIAILVQEANRKNVSIDTHALNHLLHLQNGDVALALCELDKLAVLGLETVGVKEIDALVYGMGEIDLQTFFNDLLHKKEYQHRLRTLLEAGEDEIRILTALSAYVNELYRFNIYIRIHGSPNAKEILGYSPPQFVVAQKAQEAMRIKPATYYTLHKLLLKAELAMKSANNDKRAILHATLLRFVASL